MPRLSTFYGIAIYMYIRDHGVAHFHAQHGDDEAVIAVETGELLAGSLRHLAANCWRRGIEQALASRRDVTSSAQPA